MTYIIIWFEELTTSFDAWKNYKTTDAKCNFRTKTSYLHPTTTDLPLNNLTWNVYLALIGNSTDDVISCLWHSLTHQITWRSTLGSGFRLNLFSPLEASTRNATWNCKCYCEMYWFKFSVEDDQNTRQKQPMSNCQYSENHYVVYNFPQCFDRCRIFDRILSSAHNNHAVS